MKWFVGFLLLLGFSADAQLIAGTGRIKITPTLPIWLSGYAGREKPATEVLQDLWAKALVLEDGRKNRVVIVTTEGGLWRWDGYRVQAGTATASARPITPRIKGVTAR